MNDVLYAANGEYIFRYVNERLEQAAKSDVYTFFQFCDKVVALRKNRLFLEVVGIEKNKLVTKREEKTTSPLYNFSFAQGGVIIQHDDTPFKWACLFDIVNFKLYMLD